MSPWLRAAGSIAVLLVGTDGAVQIAEGSSADLASRLVPPLVSAAGLCVLALTARRARSIAWLAVVFAATISSVDIAGWARTDHGSALTPTAAVPVLVADLAMLGAAAVAMTYAARSWRPPSRLRLPVRSLLGIVALGLAALFSADRLAAASDGSVMRVVGLAPGRWLTRTALAVIVVSIALALLGDARAPFDRARRRLVLEPAPSVDPDGRTPLRKPARFVRLGRLFADEVVGSVTDRRAAAARESERSRLAADLHALILPELRMAAATVDAAGIGAPGASRVHDAIADIESLMAERHSVVLETFGLVRGVEWLAERTEARSGVRVALAVDRDEGRPARDVERAAFRIALLALDNVVRHAPGASVAIDLSVDASAVSLDVRDDGPGIGPEALDRTTMAGRRGLDDMRREADLVGASLQVTSSGGAWIAFRWVSDRR